MDEARRRAWAALGIGPAWALRDPPRQADDGSVQRPGADAPEDALPGTADPRARGTAVQVRAELASPDPFGAAVDAIAAAEGGPVREPFGSMAAGMQAGSSGGDDPEPNEVPADDSDAVALVRSGLPSSRRDRLIADLEWSALGEAIAGCRACGLCEGRRNTVFGVGPRPASWMLVGEAPGEQEDLQGEPFVGPAGRLLDQMLAAIAVDRPSQAFIANVLKCRPPRNRDPLPEEVARCEPYLLRQVTLLRPRLIVVLGRFAAQSLLRTEASIASLRGRVHRYRAGGRDVPLIVTYHPAYLLRNLPDKAKSWADLRLARRTYDALGDGEA
ncbi:MAG: hypothetical protein RJA99_4801 [Pseudomonadota bacterium]|jgi:DNA polymerase